MRMGWRISPPEYARDLSGEGARLFGARWNREGTAVIYTSESRSLATLETLVHMTYPELPRGWKIVSIGVPKSIVPKEIKISSLPPDWHHHLAPPLLAEIGTKWAVSMESLLLRVPSAVEKHEFNIIINPQHPGIKFVNIIEVEDYVFDDRLRDPSR